MNYLRKNFDFFFFADIKEVSEVQPRPHTLNSETALLTAPNQTAGLFSFGPRLQHRDGSEQTECNINNEEAAASDGLCSRVLLTNQHSYSTFTHLPPLFICLSHVHCLWTVNMNWCQDQFKKKKSVAKLWDSCHEEHNDTHILYIYCFLTSA